MNILAVTLGISGSGKSRVSREYEENGFVRICPDDIRKELTGNISDQSRNKDVFDTAYSMIRTSLKAGEDVIFDSTAINSQTRKELLKIARECDVGTLLMVMLDSRDIALCRARVQKDINQGVDRSNTIAVENLLVSQRDKYLNSLKVIETEGWDDILRVGETLSIKPEFPDSFEE